MNDSAAKYRIAGNTQQRVLKAAASLNYIPNAFARGLRKKRSFTVGVMVPEISDGYAAVLLSGIGESLLQEKFFYFVVSHRHSAELLRNYPRLLLSRGVEGIIAVDAPIREQLPVPVVAVSVPAEVSAIGLDETGRTAAMTLLRRIREGLAFQRFGHCQ